MFRVTSIPTVKLPMGNHYGYICRTLGRSYISKRTKELPMTFPEPSQAKSRVQSPESRVHSPESKVQSLKPRVQTLKPRVQSPESISESRPAFRLCLGGQSFVYLTTRVVQPIRWEKKVNPETTAHAGHINFCGVALKLWQISWQVTNLIHYMANFRGSQ